MSSGLLAPQIQTTKTTFYCSNTDLKEEPVIYKYNDVKVQNEEIISANY